MADIYLQSFTLSSPVKIGADFVRDIEISNHGTKYYPGGHLTVVADSYFNVSSASVPSISPGQSVTIPMTMKVKGMRTVDDLPEQTTFKLDGKEYPIGNVMDDFMADLVDFKPSPACGAEKLNILLFGLAGSGKSSFINSSYTLTSPDNTKLEEPAPSGGQQGHVTRTLHRYEFKLKRSALNFCLWDTWGLTKDTYTGNELEMILDGRLPSNWEMSNEINSRESHNMLSQGEATAYKRRIHGVLFLFPQGALNDPNLNSVRQLLRKNFERVSAQGYNPYLVLTKVDEYSAKFRENPRAEAHPELVTLKTKAAQLLNIAPNRILFNINYFTETKRQFRIDKATFKILEASLNSARARSVNMPMHENNNSRSYEW